MRLDLEQLDARAGLATFGVVLGLTLWIAACGEDVTEEPESAPDRTSTLAPAWQAPPARAASEWCADCHEDVVESWSHTGMARAMGPIDPIEFAGLEQVPDAPAGLAYTYLTDAAGVSLLETSERRPEHALAAEIVYAIGAGVKDRAFVARLGAFEWFAPLEVVSTAEGRHAALAPGHMALPGVRFENSITAECLGCHTDQLPRPAFPLNLHQGPSFEPRGISCAACHGPVERHASWRTADLTGATPVGDDPILRPQELGREERMSICSACHLEGDVRIAFDSRLGIPPPGRDLLDQRAVFVAAQVSQAIGFVSHTERLVLSPCYLESDMTCGSCHDPHRSPNGDDEELRRVRDGCLGCHPGALDRSAHSSAGPCSRPEPAPAADGDCVSCHMRETPVYDVAEVTIHDHFIRARPGPPSAPAKVRTQESPSGDWVRFGWPGRPPPEAADDPGLWLLAYRHRGHTQRAHELLPLEPGPRSARLPMYHHTRGSLLEQSGQVPEALLAYERALALEPGFAPSAINLALLLGTNGQRERGLALLDEVLARHPEAVNALRNRASLRAEGGDRKGFVSDLTRAFELRPSAELAGILADFFRQVGDAVRAAEWTRRGRALDPY